MSVTRIVAVAVLLAFGAGYASAARLEPLVVGWERIFRLEWGVDERRDRPVVSGYVVNDSPYTVTAVRLLVEGLDETGAVVEQQLSWVPGAFSPFSRRYFEAQPTAWYPEHRVRVFSFDRIERNGIRRLP